MATPARGGDKSAVAPNLARKEPLCPTASAKSTPVKSPEKKRTKTDEPGGPKSLMAELDNAAAESVTWIY